MEAMAAGLASVCLDTYGARSVMRREFGALVAPAELASAIFRLLEDPAERRRMGAAARAFALRDRFEDRAAQLAQILAQA
jgi:glycosyltransferase involved in cell wall biosynthesis